MFKKIQWTFSIYFLNSNYLVSVQYQCLFLRLGTVQEVTCDSIMWSTVHRVLSSEHSSPSPSPYKYGLVCESSTLLDSTTTSHILCVYYAVWRSVNNRREVLCDKIAVICVHYIISCLCQWFLLTRCV